MSETSSSCASDSADSTPWVFYRDRPDWADVRPLPQDDGPDPVVRIAYSDKFRDVYDYFRAIYASKEVSQRALSLTMDAVELNPANYTAWHHRRFLLKELNVDLNEEMEYIRFVINGNPKNYQVWQHRRVLVEWLKDPSKEMRFTEIILSIDPKNYHVWQHRQWVMTAFNLFEGELEFVERLLDEDIRNNSAWNQRFFLITHTDSQNGQFSGDVLNRELTFTMNAIRKVLGNESAWNYFRGLIDNTAETEQAETRKKCWLFCQELFEQCDRKSNSSSYLLGAMVDLYCDQLEASESQSPKDDLVKAQELCGILAKEVDPIRKQYWEFMSRDLLVRFGSKNQ